MFIDTALEASGVKENDGQKVFVRCIFYILLAQRLTLDGQGWEIGRWLRLVQRQLGNNRFFVILHSSGWWGVPAESRYGGEI